MHKIFHFLVLLTAACLGYTSCSTAVGPYKGKFKTKYIAKDAYVFFVIGDWGRNGEENQTEVAKSMKWCAERIDPRFIISTGDNFYTYGVASIDDPQWMSSYENIYKGNALHIEWYPVLGNHDYLGNTQAQIDYTKKSRRWVMP
ncbi:MAG TPA: metallophosphoesterase, partial [Cytophagales bacterium]|nr:metallophosphoesterase [Cytophagales bacterium]